MADNQKYYYMRLKEGFFDDDAIQILESMPDGYLYTNILLKLYLKSLKFNGKLMFNERIPYNATVLATITRHNVGTVEKALDIFRSMGLIEVLDNGAIYMLDVQTLIGKTSTEADRVRSFRMEIENQKALLASEIYEDSCTDVVQNPYKCTPEIEIEKELDIEIEIETDKRKTGEKSPCPYSEIQNLYSSVCVSYPKVTRLSDARKKAIKARWSSGYGLDDFKKLFEKAEASTFLKGSNNRNWQANFDWMIKDANMAKVLDGNYDSKGGQTGGHFTPNQSNNVATTGGNTPEVPKYGKIF